MELVLAVRRQVTKAMVTKYRKATKVEKSAILDHLVEVDGGAVPLRRGGRGCVGGHWRVCLGIPVGWHPDHARKALRLAMTAPPGRW